MTAYKEEAFFFRKRDQLLADHAFDATAVADDTALLKKIGMASHVVDGILRIQGNDDNVTLRQELVCQRLLNGIYEHGFVYHRFGNIEAVNSIIGILTDRLGQGASNESQTYNSYFHDTTSILCMPVV